MTELFTEVSASRGKELGRWTRRAVVGVLVAVAALAAWGVLGQSEHASTAAANGVTITVDSPAVVRGGLYFQATIDITATTAVEHPRLVLDEGWMEGMQVSSIEPGAESETSRDGLVVLSYGALKPGDRLKVWLQFQVDPTSPGERSHGLELDDGTRMLARIDRNLRVLP